jgi:hypothetical protein
MFRLRDARRARVPIRVIFRHASAARPAATTASVYSSRGLGRFSHVIPFHLLLAALSGGSGESSATESTLTRWFPSRRRSAGAARSTTTCARMRRCR